MNRNIVTKNIPSREQKNEIVVYQPNETMRLEVAVRDESIWLPQQKIADLFGVQKAAISKHLKNIYASGELAEQATVSKMETVQTEGRRHVARRIDLYNLDAIIADRRLFLVGASLKDLGTKCFAFAQLNPSEIPNLRSRIP